MSHQLLFAPYFLEIIFLRAHLIYARIFCNITLHLLCYPLPPPPHRFDCIITKSLNGFHWLFRFRCQEKRGEILDQRLDRMGWMLHSLPGSSQDKIIPIPRPLFVYLCRRRCFQRTHFSGCHMASSVKSPLLLLLSGWTFFDGDAAIFLQVM